MTSPYAPDVVLSNPALAPWEQFDMAAAGGKFERNNGDGWRARINKVLDRLDVVKEIKIGGSFFWHDNEEANTKLFERIGQLMERSVAILQTLCMDQRSYADLLMKQLSTLLIKMNKLERLSIPFSDKLLGILANAKDELKNLRHFHVVPGFDAALLPVKFTQFTEALPFSQLQSCSIADCLLPEPSEWSAPPGLSLNRLTLRAPPNYESVLFTSSHIGGIQFESLYNTLKSQFAGNAALALGGMQFVRIWCSFSYDGQDDYTTNYCTLLDACILSQSSVPRSVLDTVLSEAGPSLPIVLKFEVEKYSKDAIMSLLKLPYFDVWKHRHWMLELLKTDNPDMVLLKAIAARILELNLPEQQLYRGFDQLSDKSNFLTAGMAAVSVNNEHKLEIYQFLFSDEILSGFKIKMTDVSEQNWTPLHYCQVSAYFEKMKSLGADPTVRSEESYGTQFTPLLSILNLFHYGRDAEFKGESWLELTNEFLKVFGFSAEIIQFYSNGTRAIQILDFVIRSLFRFYCANPNAHEQEGDLLLSVIEFQTLVNDLDQELFVMRDENIKVEMIVLALKRVFEAWRRLHPVRNEEEENYVRSKIKSIIRYVREVAAKEGAVLGAAFNEVSTLMTPETTKKSAVSHTGPRGKKNH